MKPLQVGSRLWRNRIEVAPAAPFLPWREQDGSMPLKRYYENLATSGAAAVMLGISSLEPGERAPGMVMPACAPMKLEELPALVDVLHSGGALAGVEITVMRYMMGARDRISTMSAEEIRAIIQSYVNQAKTALEAGFDILMIHGGHGNVPAQFFAEYLNKRTDAYGGSAEKRSRFALELLDAVRDAVGDRLILEYRISAEEILPGTTRLPETIDFARRIQDRVDLLQVSRGLLEEDDTLPYINSPTYLPRGSNLPFARQFKAALDIPVSVVCGMDLDTAEAAIARGEVDAAAMIRTALADPHFVANAAAGQAEKTRPCVRCNTCIGRTHSQRLPVRCAVNPLLGREAAYAEVPQPKHKSVAVVGGGPAGMEGARTAAARGCRVTLLEKTDHLGGSLCLASAADFKQDMRRYLSWAVRETLAAPGVSVRLNTEATPALLAELQPEAVIVAAGAKPILPKLPHHAEKAIWVGDLERDLSRAGQRVVVAGAGFTGMEMALSLVRAGREVTVIDLLPPEKIGADGVAISMTWLKAALREAGVRFRCQVRLEDCDETGAVVSTAEGGREVLPCDTVVLSLGVRADKSAEEAVRALGYETLTAGDCSQSGGTLFKAVSGGFEAAMCL